MSNNLIVVNKITKVYDEDIFFRRGTNYHVLNKIDYQSKCRGKRRGFLFPSPLLLRYLTCQLKTKQRRKYCA